MNAAIAEPNLKALSEASESLNRIRLAAYDAKADASVRLLSDMLKELDAFVEFWRGLAADPGSSSRGQRNSGAAAPSRVRKLPPRQAMPTNCRASARTPHSPAPWCQDREPVAWP